jgi:hypothetical protein
VRKFQNQFREDYFNQQLSLFSFTSLAQLYTVFSDLSTKLDFFTQVSGVCAQVLSKKIVAPNFGHVLLHTEWAFGRFRIFTDASTVNLLAPESG